MGYYETFGDVQLKIFDEDFTNERQWSYKIGDKAVGYQDGIYIGYEGFVVIKDGIFIAEFEKAFDKYGGEIDPHEFIDLRNPITQVIKDFENNTKQNNKT